MTHYPEVAAALDPTTVDLIAYGHDHTLALAHDGAAVRVDPGTLMGYRPTDRSEVPATFAIYDTGTRRASAFRIGEAGVEPHASGTAAG
jgi:predicted phosphodiesterase